jgi:hypothetical protein
MCTSVDTLFDTVEASLSGVDVMLEAVETAIPDTVATDIEAGVQIALNGVTELKSLYDQYEENETAPGVVNDLQNALTTVQTNIQGILKAANIDNATVQAWVEKVVNLTATLVQDVASKILPVFSSFHTPGNTMPTAEVIDRGKALSKSLKQLKNKFVSDWDTALAWDNVNESGALDSVATGASKKVHDHFHDVIARQIPLIHARV